MTTRVKGALAAEARVAMVQDTVPVAPTAGVEQLQPPGLVSETNVVPAGRVSVRPTLWASLGPALAAVIVEVRSAPAATGSGLSVLVTERFADVVTVFVSLAVLLPGVGSGTGLDTTAVFVWLPAGVEAGTV